MKGFEIERKFLIKSDFVKGVEFENKYVVGYLNVEPEVRVYKRVKIEGEKEIKEDRYRLTIKGNGDLTRVEVEKDLDEKEFSLLYNMSKYRCEKRSFTAEGMRISIATNSFGDEVITGEVEFDSEAKAHKYKVPDFVVKDITYDSKYKMKNFASRGIGK